jgi:hypothetical protein
MEAKMGRAIKRALVGNQVAETDQDQRLGETGRSGRAPRRKHLLPEIPSWDNF